MKGTRIRPIAVARAWLCTALVCAAAAPARAARLEPAPEGLDATAIAQRADDVMRSDSSYLEATMTVVSPRISKPRKVRFRSWDDRRHRRSFIRILAPAKDKGSGFLKLHPNLWMYIPRVERTVRVPPSMMLQSWMGSDFTNDDLVKESREVDDYQHRVLGFDPYPEGRGGKGAWVVEYVPHEEAPVVWGKIVAWIDREHGTPLRQEFFDEDGEKLRVLRFDDIRPVQGRRVPHRWSMTPLDKKGHETVIEIETIRFDEPLDEAVFTTHHLKRRE